MTAAVERVLIYRLGSLGDTIVCLPCLHLVARAFAGAERRILTNVPVSTKAAPLEQVLGDSGLAHGYLRYPVGLRRPGPLLRLRHEIRAWRPQVLVYLTAPRGRRSVLRDLAFFRLCGIGRIVGAPATAALAEHRYVPERGRWEYESERLARCLAALGDAALERPGSWDLSFTGAERQAAAEALADWTGAARFVAFSIGAKVDVKDWGDGNWAAVLDDIGRARPGLGLVLVGTADEAARTRALAARWPGPVRDLCGRLAPRVSALTIAGARLFLGHDSGPMHLAAAVGTPAVAVFSARAKPGVWFPYGERHRPIYHRTPCFDCRLEVCTRFAKQCILSIRPAEVVEASLDVLGPADGG